jgi:hypothetical protein
LRLPDDTQSGIPVEMKLDDIYVVIVSGEETLGEWRMDDIGIERLFSNQFLLDLAGEEMVFIADDPLGFAYEGIGYIDETSERLSKRRRFRKKKGRPDRRSVEVVDADREEAVRVKERRRATFDSSSAPAPEPALASAPVEPAVESLPAVEPPPAVEEPIDVPVLEDSEPAGAPLYSAMFEQPQAPVDAVIDDVVEAEQAPAAVEAPATEEASEEPLIEDEFEIEEVAPTATAAFLDPGSSPETDAAEPSPAPSLAGDMAEAPVQVPMEDEEFVIEEVAGMASSATFESAVTSRPVLPVIEPAKASPESVEQAEEPEVEPPPEPAPPEPAELFPQPPESARREPEPYVPEPERVLAEPEPEPVPEPAAVDGGAGHTRRERRLRRRRREEEPVHEHHYEEKASVGGIIRRVCAECGHVSFGSRDIYEPW